MPLRLGAIDLVCKEFFGIFDPHPPLSSTQYCNVSESVSILDEAVWIMVIVLICLANLADENAAEITSPIVETASLYYPFKRLFTSKGNGMYLSGS